MSNFYNGTQKLDNSKQPDLKSANISNQIFAYLALFFGLVAAATVPFIFSLAIKLSSGTIFIAYLVGIALSLIATTFATHFLRSATQECVSPIKKVLARSGQLLGFITTITLTILILAVIILLGLQSTWSYLFGDFMSGE